MFSGSKQVLFRIAPGHKSRLLVASRLRPLIADLMSHCSRQVPISLGVHVEKSSTPGTLTVAVPS